MDSPHLDADAPFPEAVICPKCLLNNKPQAAFCADCGAPIGMVANVDPIQRIYAEGFAYRSAMEGPPKLILVFGIWFSFLPLMLVPAVILHELDWHDPTLTVLEACFLLGLVWMTVNLVRKCRQAIITPDAPKGTVATRLVLAVIWGPLLGIPVYLGSDMLLEASMLVGAVIVIVALGSVPYRTTKNYIVKSRAARELGT